MLHVEFNKHLCHPVSKASCRMSGMKQDMKITLVENTTVHKLVTRQAHISERKYIKSKL